MTTTMSNQAMPNQAGNGNTKPVIGAVEWIALPQLSVSRIRARVDTGAASSSLHVEDTQVFQQDGRDWAQFTVIVGQIHQWRKVSASAPIVGIKRVRNTGGEIEERYLIRTELQLGSISRFINITLSERSKMRYRMLLGRSAMKGLLVDPSHLYLQGLPYPS